MARSIDVLFVVSIFLFSVLGIWQFRTNALPGMSVPTFESSQRTAVFACNDGSVKFKSDAPLETIQAESKKLRGVFDPEHQTYAWTVEIRSFQGFNNPLQREHFNENYMESRRFSRAIFTGKVIEKIDFDKNGTYSVRAKGKLNIHGKEQERIIKSQLVVKGKRVTVQSSFRVILTDHDIRIPKIVYQKIAEELLITVEAELLRK